MFGLQTLQHMMRMTRTWDATMSMIPKGGDTIWGGLDWSPEGFYNCSAKKQKNNGAVSGSQNGATNKGSAKGVNYGRIISFGNDVAAVHSSEIERIDFRVLSEFHISSSNALTVILLVNGDYEIIGVWT